MPGSTDPTPPASARNGAGPPAGSVGLCPPALIPLHADQRHFLRALDLGPSAVPFQRFSGPPERILMAFAAHANTMNHGRLSALEASFPLCVNAMGQEAFLVLAREHLADGPACTRPLAGIGGDFPEFMARRDLPGTLVDLARVERAWLESHGAAEAPALGLPALAGLPPARLLALPLFFHPAVRLVELTAAPHPLLDLPAVCPAVAIVRPEAEVRILPLLACQRAMMTACDSATTIEALLAAAQADGGTMEDHLAGLIALIEQGLFMEVDHAA